MAADQDMLGIWTGHLFYTHVLLVLYGEEAILVDRLSDDDDYLENKESKDRFPDI